jgi:hypothetical protein
VAERPVALPPVKPGAPRVRTISIRQSHAVSQERCHLRHLRRECSVAIRSRALAANAGLLAGPGRLSGSRRRTTAAAPDMFPGAGGAAEPMSRRRIRCPESAAPIPNRAGYECPWSPGQPADGISAFRQGRGSHPIRDRAVVSAASHRRASRGRRRSFRQRRNSPVVRE